MSDLTPAKIRTLEALSDKGTHTGRQLAILLWPDSPGWDKRSRRRGGGNRNGALGATMPMKGAAAGWALERLGLAKVEYNDVHTPFFSITFAGEQALEKARS